MSAEDFGGTIEAYTYPDEFAECDGSVEIAPGVFAGQQSRKQFGLSYRTILGNDVDSDDYGYKLHLVYGCLASPSEKGYQTKNDSPEPIALSWEFSTTPAEISKLIEGKRIKPTAILTFDSTRVFPTLRVSGTCFANTTIFKLMLLILVLVFLQVGSSQ